VNLAEQGERDSFSGRTITQGTRLFIDSWLNSRELDLKRHYGLLRQQYYRSISRRIHHEANSFTVSAASKVLAAAGSAWLKFDCGPSEGRNYPAIRRRTLTESWAEGLVKGTVSRSPRLEANVERRGLVTSP
jgi:hypothetical protein